MLWAPLLAVLAQVACDRCLRPVHNTPSPSYLRHLARCFLSAPSGLLLRSSHPFVPKRVFSIGSCVDAEIGKMTKVGWARNARSSNKKAFFFCLPYISCSWLCIVVNVRMVVVLVDDDYDDMAEGV